MNAIVYPSMLNGTVSAPSSKSISHRLLIAASLTEGVSEIQNISTSSDIEATVSVLEALGAEITNNGSEYRVKGIFSNNISPEEGTVDADCRESGSTLRFLIPVAAVLGKNTRFLGRGKLPERPITPYLRELPKNGTIFEYDNNTMPFSLKGKLRAGEYSLEGDISSQFITGLLMALPLCDGDSTINVTSELQSKPYVDMTLEALKLFGVSVDTRFENGLYSYHIRGGQRYIPVNTSAEGDYSQAAFFFVANAIGCSVKIENLAENSSQGDKAIIDIINNCGKELNPFEVDAGDIPDLVPILAVLGCFTNGDSRIVNAARLRIKESDRLEAISSALNAIGGNIDVYPDGLVIHPVKEFTGGTVNACNDHRIVMASAIAAVRSSAPVTIIGAEAVNKSYPSFFDDFRRSGGNVNICE